MIGYFWLDFGLHKVSLTDYDLHLCYFLQPLGNSSYVKIYSSPRKDKFSHPYATKYKIIGLQASI